MNAAAVAVLLFCSDPSLFRFDTAKALYEAGQCPAALTQLELSEKNGEPAPDRGLYRGMCLAQLGQWEQARPLLRAGVEQRRDNGEAWYWLGASEYYTREYQRAGAALDRAIELRPKDGHAYRMRGLVHIQQNRWNEGYLDWVKAVRLNPRDVRTLSYLGQLFHEAGRYDQAKLWLEDALRVDGNHYEALTYLGLCEERLGNTDGAAKLYARAVAASEAAGKPYAWAYTSLAKVWRNEGRNEEARALLEKAAGAAPEASLLYTLAQLQFEAKQHAEAERSLRHALSLEASSTEARYLLSRVLIALGRREEAKAELKRFQETKESAKPAPKVTVVAK